jgi:hypothetical protein
MVLLVEQVLLRPQRTDQAAAAALAQQANQEQLLGAEMVVLVDRVISREPTPIMQVAVVVAVINLGTKPV